MRVSDPEGSQDTCSYHPLRICSLGLLLSRCRLPATNIHHLLHFALPCLPYPLIRRTTLMPTCGKHNPKSWNTHDTFILFLTCMHLPMFLFSLHGIAPLAWITTTAFPVLQQRPNSQKKEFYAVINDVVIQDGIGGVLVCEPQLTCNCPVPVLFLHSYFCAVKTKKTQTPTLKKNKKLINTYIRNR